MGGDRAESQREPDKGSETGKLCLVAKKMDESVLYHDQSIARCYKPFMDANDKYAKVTE